MLSPLQLAQQAWLELPDGQLFWLRARTTIGRQANNDLALTDTTLSRQHAVISFDGRDYTLADTQSRNGTYVGAKMLTQPAMLQDGDHVRLGAFTMRFRRMRPWRATSAADDGGQTTQALPVVERVQCWLAVATLEDKAAPVNEPGVEESVKKLQGWIAGLRPLVEQHAGAINRYLGDAMLAFWPCSASKASDVLSAVRDLTAWRSHSPLPFRLALHQGAVLVAKTEHGDDLDGSDLDFVARMDPVAEKFGAQVMLSAAAARSLGVEGRCETLGPAAIEGAGVSSFYGLAVTARPPPVAPTDDGFEAAVQPGKAVFLSYASQDAPAVRRICDALRAAKVEVWFDQNDLHGGDAWDQKIRRQVKACAIFVPVISANTQARREGYFRLEWKLAAQRMHSFADGVPFLLPIVIDGTAEAAALVPAEFREVHWTRLQQAGEFAAFAQRVRGLVE